MVLALPEPGPSLAAWCAAVLVLSALVVKSGRAPRTAAAWVTVLLVGMILAAMWLR
jgi:hypothetical protein